MSQHNCYSVGRLTHTKSVQTDPVIILPLDTYLALLENINQLPDQSNNIYEPATCFNIKQADHNSPKTSLYKTYDYEAPYSEIPSQNDTYELEGDSSYETVFKTTNESLPLYKPIYALKESLFAYDIDDWEAGDEFEFISYVDNNPTMLCLKHLRTSVIKNIDRSHVELDENTPLRLGIQDRGAIECFLLKCEARYSFLIYRSDQHENTYILSVNQHHTVKEGFIFHYFIRINKENHCFYLEHERRLRHCFFRTFQQLVNDARVHEFIPLSKPIDRKLSVTENELWQIDYKQLSIGKKIGAGEFGEVLSGKWKRNGLFEEVDVAIKRLKLNNVTSNEFAKEIRAMQRLRNKYLVTLLGISVDSTTNEKLMITEYMADGDLKNWLERQLKLPSDNILINYCHQICLGMSHLERHKYVHSDLACRNVLLRGDRAKIADFGMTSIIEEDPYYRETKSSRSIGKLPFRWTAPEIFDGGNFTTKSDVWSFGICLVEIWSKGGLPYPSLKRSSEVRLKIQEGYIHDKPAQCQEKYYNIIKSCLTFDPDYRPTFKTLTDHFKNFLIIENEKNPNRNLEKNDSIARYWAMKEKEVAPIINPQISPSNEVDKTGQKQTKYTSNGNHYIYADAASAAKQFSSNSLNDTSRYKTTTAYTYSANEVITDNIYICMNPSNSNNYDSPYSIYQTDKKYSSTSSSHVVKDKTNDHVYNPVKSTNVNTSSTISNTTKSSKVVSISNYSAINDKNNENIDLLQKTDEDINPYLF